MTCALTFTVLKYFLHFEKVVTTLKWPKEVWTSGHQSVLTGRAQGIVIAFVRSWLNYNVSKTPCELIK